MPAGGEGQAARSGKVQRLDFSDDKPDSARRDGFLAGPEGVARLPGLHRQQASRALGEAGKPGMEKIAMFTRKAELADPENRACGRARCSQRKACHGGHVTMARFADLMHALTAKVERKALIWLSARLTKPEDAGNIEGSGLHMFLFCSRAKESSSPVFMEDRACEFRARDAGLNGQALPACRKLWSLS